MPEKRKPNIIIRVEEEGRPVVFECGYCGKLWAVSPVAAQDALAAVAEHECEEDE